MRPITNAFLLAGLAMAPLAHATVSDPNWTETTLTSDGSQHTGLAWAPDGSDRLFVIEKTGRVRVFSGYTTTGTGTWSTFATMSPITTTSECGLIGMAFDPDFARNHYVYFFVTVSSSEQQIIRYDASGAMGTGRTVIKTGLPTTGNNHDGGGVGFAADGKLYWSVGDNGSGVGVDNNLTSLGSKVGRANRDGTLPTDNPFDDGAGPNNDFIWARGMRNPFTMQIQPSTGLMWLNVVGDGYEQVFVVHRGDHGGYNDFENNQPASPPGYITPKIVYRTNGSDTPSIVSVTRSGNIATYTTMGSHRFRQGSNVSITGVSDASFNGANQYVASEIDNTHFTIAQAGPNATGTGGTATGLNQGGCLTGGVFYDNSMAGAAYRGNFFYGDCNSARIMRARIDNATNAVLGVDYWATGISSQVDIAVGPDGALYYVGVGTSNVYRAAFNATSQGLVVNNLNLWPDEGGEVVTSVRLAQQPANAVQVDVARTAGDTDVGVAAGATLTFDSTNWNRPQLVRLAVATDGDGINDTATVSVSSTGLATVPIAVHVLDTGSAGEAPLFSNGFE
ncbi:MAG TPA: PQQ-dependent sugar dehydrogenase [Xanthomonadales bacterium]|nr:PQQ-dependent sugar dehydrogenase [Xanthomonadales bacterium]